MLLEHSHFFFSLEAQSAMSCSKPITASEAVNFEYLADIPLYITEKPYVIEQAEGVSDVDSTNVQSAYYDQSGNLHDLRGREKDFSIESHSFCFEQHHTDLDLVYEEESMIPYAEEVNQLLKDKFKTEHVICYDLRVCIAISHSLILSIKTYAENFAVAQK